MNHLLLTILLILSSCSKHSDHETVNGYDEVREIDRVYSALIADDPYRLTTPGDALTFVGLYAAAKKWGGLYDHRYKGTWNRNVYEVYPIGESRSGISLEGMLAAINFLLSMNDIDGIREIYDYGKSNDWVFGEGPKEYTRMPQLQPLLSPFLESNLHDLWEFPSFEGYRGNVIGLWIATKGRMFGYIRGIELETIKQLAKAEPENPIYHAILHRYTDGDQSKVIEILSSFPDDRLPLDPMSMFAWNDAPPAILFVWTVFLIGESDDK